MRVNTIYLEAGGPVGIQLDSALRAGTVVTVDVLGVPEILELNGRGLQLALDTRAMEIFGMGTARLRRVQVSPPDMMDLMKSLPIWHADGNPH